MTGELLSTTALANKMLILFEKEKGGVGSTGTLISLAHHYIVAETPIVFVEASTTQNDVYNAYKDHHRVERVDLGASDASDRLIDVVATAPEHAVILANVPGGRIEALDEVHSVIAYAREHMAMPIETRIVWTMGLDLASRTTLLAMLEGEVPGSVYLNLPQWHGSLDAYSNVDDSLVKRIHATGGEVFATPSMPPHLYDLFRKDEIATDRIATHPKVTFGNKVALGRWQAAVKAVIEDLF